jgi:hypothetical protein
LISIEDYAFYDCGFTSIQLPDSLIRIGESAFSSDAFRDGSKNLTIIASKDSYAYQYAKKNYINFKEK